jgi:hypothetical protein
MSSLCYLCCRQISSCVSNAVALCPDVAWFEYVELGYLNKTLTIRDLKIFNKCGSFKDSNSKVLVI